MTSVEWTTFAYRNQGKDCSSNVSVVVLGNGNDSVIRGVCVGFVCGKFFKCVDLEDTT